MPGVVQVGDVCSRLYEKGMVKERERRNIQVLVATMSDTMHSLSFVY